MIIAEYDSVEAWFSCEVVDGDVLVFVVFLNDFEVDDALVWWGAFGVYFVVYYVLFLNLDVLVLDGAGDFLLRLSVLCAFGCFEKAYFDVVHLDLNIDIDYTIWL